MKQLLDCANQYIEESDWKIIALLKFCLISMGILIGMCIPRKEKKTVAAASGAVFGITYIILMAKFVRLICRRKSGNETA